MSPSGKAQDFDSCIRGFESRHPCHPAASARGAGITLRLWRRPAARYDLVAQSAEHLPFKQGVRGSNPRQVTKGLAKKAFGFSKEKPNAFFCQLDACGKGHSNCAQFEWPFPAAALQRTPKGARLRGKRDFFQGTCPWKKY